MSGFGPPVKPTPPVPARPPTPSELEAEWIQRPGRLRGLQVNRRTGLFRYIP